MHPGDNTQVYDVDCAQAVSSIQYASVKNGSASIFIRDSYQAKPGVLAQSSHQGVKIKRIKAGAGR